MNTRTVPLFGLLLVAGCGSRPPAASPPPADIYNAWIDAVEARSADRIAALISIPALVSYDDGLSSGRTPDCAPWPGGVRNVMTVEQRAQLAACLATNLRHSRFTDPIHPTGELTLTQLGPLVEPPIRALLEPFAPDHRFVHGHTIGAGESDFTFAVSRTTNTIDLVVITAAPRDEGPAGFDESESPG